MGKAKHATTSVVCPPGWTKLDTPHGETYRRTVRHITVGVTRDDLGTWSIFAEDEDSLGVESAFVAANRLGARDAVGAMMEADRRVVHEIRCLLAAWENGRT